MGVRGLYVRRRYAYDEIQRCPRARTALKFLAIDGKYDVIASGSLLGIHYKSSLDGKESE